MMTTATASTASSRASPIWMARDRAWSSAVVTSALVLVAWNWRAGQLRRVWTFDTDREHATDRDYRGQGNHNLSVADVDGDRRDEIIYGACTIDDDGTGLYTTGLGHGDALHVADIDPSRPRAGGLGHPREAAASPCGKPAGRGHGAASLEPRSARSGPRIGDRYRPSTPRLRMLDQQLGRALQLPGPEDFRCQTSFVQHGRLVGRRPAEGNPGRPRGGSRSADRAFIDKWDPVKETTLRLLSGGDFDCATNNGTKATPCLCADILGDRARKSSGGQSTTANCGSFRPRSAPTTDSPH